jgi:hypothetical protein
MDLEAETETEMESALRGLLTKLSDLQEGYRRSTEAGGDPMTVALLSYLFSTHLVHSDRLILALRQRGMAAEALASGRRDAEPDEVALPSLLERETGIVAAYRDVILALGLRDVALTKLLLGQRAALEGRIEVLRRISQRSGGNVLRHSPRTRQVLELLAQ